jgi:hypothetical protein
LTPIFWDLDSTTMKRVDFWKIFRLPSPEQLGWGNGNSLPMKIFQSIGDSSPTWEDWEEKMRKEYPMRYFLAETLPGWYRSRIKRPLVDFHYWIVSHIIPGRRYHMLDLRQPEKINNIDNPDAYRYGWMDCDSRMLFAIFNLLNDFVEGEMPHSYCPSEEEVRRDPSLLSQRSTFLEIKAIHYWWNVERKRAARTISEAWSKAHKIKDDMVAHRQIWVDVRKMEQEQEDKTNEMIARLMKIRRSLWT